MNQECCTRHTTSRSPTFLPIHMDVMWLISVEQGCDSRNMDVHCEWIIERCKQRVDE